MIYGFFDKIIKFTLASFYKWKKENWKIDFFGCKEIFIRSGYYKLFNG